MQINEKKKNPWQAPPITFYDTVYVKKEKTLDDIKPGHIIINFKTSEGLKKSGMSYIKLYL